MPVGVALGRGPAAWVDAAGGASLEPADTALIGFRDKEESLTYGMLQPEDLDPEPIHLSVEAVRTEGPAAASERMARSLSAHPFWIHLDVDVLDQDVFRATDYLMSGGMTWSELAAALGPLASSPALAGASLACYNPEKDPGAGVRTGAGRGAGRRLLGLSTPLSRPACAPRQAAPPTRPSRSPAATRRTSCRAPRRR